MEATLTELHRETAKVVRPVIHGGQKLTLTDRGVPCAEIVRARKVDRKALLALIRSIGPVDLPSRK
jgi:antitoxin (DNA-binding transcriptional repressor) of toxin-antitoxin stability system